jgi:hypothetical protein
MRLIAALWLLLMCSACGVAAQPEGAKTVAAFEIPLPTERERAEFIAIVRDAAEAEGHHLDAADEEELRDTASAIPEARMTVHAAVWRGSDDDEPLATIMDQADHLGLVWIMFSKGEDPDLNRRFQERAMKAIMNRWPNTLSLPIMPNGAIPLHGDLVRTPTGYEVSPAEASKYELRETDR